MYFIFNFTFIFYRTHRSLLRWRTWPNGSGQFWWLQHKWRSMRRILKCWWICSTVWPIPTRAPLSFDALGSRAWPRFTSATGISQRFEMLHFVRFSGFRNIDNVTWKYQFKKHLTSVFPSGCYVLHPHLSPDCWIVEEERLVHTLLPLLPLRAFCSIVCVQISVCSAVRFLYICASLQTC